MSDDLPNTNCSNCHTSESVSHYSYHECDGCREPIGPVPAVPVAELDALIDELVDKEVELHGANERVEGYEWARERLEELASEHE